MFIVDAFIKNLLMSAKWIFILILFVIAAGTASAGKLGLTDRLGGTYIVSFHTQYGDVKVFLPDDTAGGDTVSASVFSYPRGTTDSVKTKNAAVLSSYKIYADGESTSVQDGRITINIPTNMSGSSLKITLRDEGNREISYSSAAVKRPDLYADRPETPTAFDFETPLIGQSGRLVEIKGPFDGDFATTQLTVGSSPANVIAESPRKLVFEAPVNISGSAEIALNENGVVVKRPFTSLRVVKIGEDSSSPASGVVPEGYTAAAPEAVIPEEARRTTQITEEAMSAEVTSPEPALTEQEPELDIEQAEVDAQTDAYTPPSNGSAKAEIALLLDAQLNVSLQGAPALIEAEKIDTVVIRETTSSVDIESREKLSVKSQEGEIEDEIIEEDILVVEKKDLSDTPSDTTQGDSSYSSKKLIERIYESTREDGSTSPPEAARKAADSHEPGESLSEEDITARPADETSYSEKGKYTVQVASFKDAAVAKSYARGLERKGYRVNVTRTDVPGKGTWNRVSVGRFLTKGQAIEYGNKLKRDEPEIKSVFITETK